MTDPTQPAPDQIEPSASGRTDASPAAPGGPSFSAAPTPYPGQPVDSLARYFEVNRPAFTEEALADAAATAGYPDEAIGQGMDQVHAREASAPVRARATWIVLAAYLITYAALEIGMIASDYSRETGAAIIGTVVLSVGLGIALLLSLRLLHGRSRSARADLALGGLVAAPLVALVIVAGLCVATGLPIPRPY